MMLQAQPQHRADHAAGAHSEPVWAVQWLDKGPESEETLVSVSTDGRVCHWSMGQVMVAHASSAPHLCGLCLVPWSDKHALIHTGSLEVRQTMLRLLRALSTAQGLEHADIMLLKPRQHHASKDVQPTAGALGASAAPPQSFLGRSSGGFCLAFPEGKGGREYIVGEFTQHLHAQQLTALSDRPCPDISGLLGCAIMKEGCTHCMHRQCWVRNTATGNTEPRRLSMQALRTVTSTSAQSAALTTTWRPTGVTWPLCTRCATAPSSAAPSYRPRPTAPPECGTKARQALLHRPDYHTACLGAHPNMPACKYSMPTPCTPTA